LIKGGETLERLASPGTLLLDKTGTITTGCVTLQSWAGDESVKPMVAALERQSTHPIARALVRGIEKGGDCSRLAARNVVQKMEGGIVGEVEGRRLAVGSMRFVEADGAELPVWVREEMGRVLGEGLSPVLVSVGGVVRAVAGVGDEIREDVQAALAALRQRGWKLAILSGDHPDVVAKVAEKLGIEDARGGLLPEQKLAIVGERMKAGENAVMVGDGVNDAAALAAASVGIAVHGGAEASLAAANVYLNRPGLGAVVELVEGSRGVVRVIRRAMVASICYNAFAVGLAVCGLINPLVAAVLMPVSSLTVLSLALSQRTFRGGVR
jgi:Cu2+-exporting ATPase